MDDKLEKPSAVSQPADLTEREDDEQSSGDEDQGPDWTKLPTGASRPVIPKRGEKDFEPNVTGGSGLQRHVLDRSRNAMIDALSAPRTISSKHISYGVWHPDIARAHVTLQRGVHFASMGHSVPRPSTQPDAIQKIRKRLELLPEEALYLVERGGMLCWKACDIPLETTPGLEGVEGVPMTVQQAFAEMIGKEYLTLEKYQVYAYLRRLGYVVTRAKPPTSDYPQPPPRVPSSAHPQSIAAQIYHSLLSVLLRVLRVFARSVDHWRPLKHSRWLHHNMDNRSIFRSLRFLPAGHDVPLTVKEVENALPSPYEIFYDFYKPSTPFKKTAPPSPDYSVVIVNARTTPMPSLIELSALFDELPELPPPVPRKRMSFAEDKAAAEMQKVQQQQNLAPVPPPTTSPSVMHRIFPWAFSKAAAPAPRPPNPFMHLKTGKKMVVVAAVDAGTISFFRFGQGVFVDWPML